MRPIFAIFNFLRGLKTTKFHEVPDGTIVSVYGEDSVGNLIKDDVPSGGAAAFTDLSDVPQSYTDQAGKMLVVNEDENGLEYTDSHTHTNKDVLDGIIDSGDGDEFLSDDGDYKAISGLPAGANYETLFYYNGWKKSSGDAQGINAGILRYGQRNNGFYNAVFGKNLINDPSNSIGFSVNTVLNYDFIVFGINGTSYADNNGNTHKWVFIKNPNLSSGYEPTGTMMYIGFNANGSVRSTNGRGVLNVNKINSDWTTCKLQCWYNALSIKASIDSDGVFWSNSFTASKLVATNASKELVSTDLIDLSGGSVVKMLTADDAIQSDTTLSAVSDFTQALLASSKYRVTAKLTIHQVGGEADFKMQLAAPSGSTITGSYKKWIDGTNTEVVNNLYNDLTSVISVEMDAYTDAAGYYYLEIEGIIETSTTAGNFTFSFAQLNSIAEITTLKKYSIIELTKI